MENKNEVSQTSQQNEAVPSERFYKDTLIPQKKSKVVFQGEIVRGFQTKKLIESKVACKLFPGTTLKDFVHYVKPTLHENEFDTSVLHMAVNYVLKLSSNIDSVKRYYQYWKPYCISL